jgi:hypothetical protein
MGTGLDEKIDIAFLIGVTPGERAEHTHSPNAVLGCDSENRGTFFIAQIGKGHTLLSSYRQRRRGREA